MNNELKGYEINFDEIKKQYKEIIEKIAKPLRNAKGDFKLLGQDLERKKREAETQFNRVAEEKSYFEKLDSTTIPDYEGILQGKEKELADKKEAMEQVEEQQSVLESITNDVFIEFFLKKIEKLAEETKKSTEIVTRKIEERREKEKETLNNRLKELKKYQIQSPELKVAIEKTERDIRKIDEKYEPDLISVQQINKENEAETRKLKIALKNGRLFSETLAEIDKETKNSDKKESKKESTRGLQEFLEYVKDKEQETPETETPETETPETETPETETPETETPETETPETETPETQTPETETPETQTPETPTPTTEPNIEITSIEVDMKNGIYTFNVKDGEPIVVNINDKKSLEEHGIKRSEENLENHAKNPGYENGLTKETQEMLKPSKGDIVDYVVTQVLLHYDKKGEKGEKEKNLKKYVRFLAKSEEKEPTDEMIPIIYNVDGVKKKDANKHIQKIVDAAKKQGRTSMVEGTQPSLLARAKKGLAKVGNNIKDFFFYPKETEALPEGKEIDQDKLDELKTELSAMKSDEDKIKKLYEMYKNPEKRPLVSQVVDDLGLNAQWLAYNPEEQKTEKKGLFARMRDRFSRKKEEPEEEQEQEEEQEEKKPKKSKQEKEQEQQDANKKLTDELGAAYRKLYDRLKDEDKKDLEEEFNGRIEAQANLAGTKVGKTNSLKSECDKILLEMKVFATKLTMEPAIDILLTTEAGSPERAARIANEQYPGTVEKRIRDIEPSKNDKNYFEEEEIAIREAIVGRMATGANIDEISKKIWIPDQLKAECEKAFANQQNQSKGQNQSQK